MKEHLKFHLERLNPMKACELMSKAEAVAWGFEHGYFYRKILELKAAFRKENFGELQNELARIENRKQISQFLSFGLIDEAKAARMLKDVDIFKPAPETSEVLNFDYAKMEREVKELLRGSLKDDEACPTCFNNPAVERIFTANEISMKLHDAKFRGLIDGEQLFKLLDYFEEKENEDKSN